MAGLACFAAAAVLLAAFASDRGGGVDETGLFNPSYMLARHGRLTYPIYSYFDAPVIVHPPLHVGLIGLFLRAGVPWYYAEALPTVMLFLLAIAAIVRAPFPAAARAGLLFSVVVVTMVPGLVLFGTRPEGAVHAAWLAGLVLLESGRLDRWNLGRLFAGAFVLTWAAAMHYYAVPGLLGVAVYMAWAAFTPQSGSVKRRIIALAAGGCLIGVPYLIGYILPWWREILATVAGTEGGVGLGAALRLHAEIYREWSAKAGVPFVLAWAMRPGIPLVLVAVPLLAAVPAIRGLALAALPLLAFITFGAAHKQYSYLVHEWSLLTAAVVTALLLGASCLLDRARASEAVRTVVAAVMLAGLCLSAVAGSTGKRISLTGSWPRVHEAEIARAACRSILGPDARVVSRLGAWYTSGAGHWLRVPDYLPEAPDSYFRRFDAAAEFPHMAEYGAISSAYAARQLHLRGFYLAESDPDSSVVLLTAGPAGRVHGFVREPGRLLGFEPDPAGDREAVTAICPGVASRGGIALPLPPPRAASPQSVVTLLVPRGDAGLRQRCQVIGTVPGSVRAADPAALVAALRGSDPPIEFCRGDTEPGCALPMTLIPPSGAAEVPGAIALDRVELADPRTVLERGTPIRVTTPGERGIFAVSIPVTATVAAGSVHLRLRVRQGVVRAATVAGGRIQTTAPAPVSPSSDPVDVAFPVPRLVPGQAVVILNESAGSSVVELYAASVLAPR